MKKLIVMVMLAVGFIMSASCAFADDYVSGYTKSNGTYVSGYHRSSANSTTSDNYSHSGNVNPWTGKRGYNND